MTRRPITPLRCAPALVAGWRSRLGVVGLLVALLCLQHLGLAHRYAHGVVPAGVHAMQQQKGASGDLLPAHDQAACQLLDQLCVGDAVPTAVSVCLACAAVPTVPMWPVPQAHVAEGVPFQARAPPAVV